MRSIITKLRSSARGSRRVGLAVAAAAFVLACWSTTGLAAPVWRIDASGNTTASPSGDLPILVQVTNTGDAAADGTATPITLTGTAPAGVDIVSVTPTGGGMFGWDCSATTSTTISCTDSSDFVDIAANTGGLNYGTLQVDATVNGAPVGSTVTTSLTVDGGGAAPASTVEPTKITAAPPGFGVDAFDGQVSDAAGGAFTQAGGHPDDASVTLDFNTSTDPNPFVGPLWPIEPVKDVIVDLPPGFVGNATNSEQCTPSLLSPQTGGPRCPSTSQVGTTLVRINGLGVRNVLGPIAVYNMVPPPNVPARFGFNVAGNVVTLDAHLRSGSDYGLSIEAHNIPQGLGVAGNTVTFWGVPSSPAHDAERACTPTTLSSTAPWEGGPACASGATQTAFLRNPTSCTAPGVGLPTTAHIDSWDHPGTFVSQTFVSHLPPAYPAAPADQGAQQGPTGCAQVPFDPTLAGTPDTSKTSSPTGFAFDLRLPQTDDPTSIGEGDLRTAVVTLPDGVRVSPSSAGGLDACTPTQIGLHSEADANCPDASKVGSLTIRTPLLRDALTGAIYLAKPHDNPFDSLIAIYLVAKGPGLIVKLAGQVAPDPLTGQLTATFDNQPQLPFSSLHLEFKGGPRAPLATPRMCGSYRTSAVITSWSGKVVRSDSSFTVDRNSKGGGCANPGFSPGFTAGTENPAAGATSAFQLGLTRGDDDQEIRSLTVDMPAGLTGKIANAVLCKQDDAKAGTCGEGSRVGTVTVGAGPGSNPFYITNGRAYITDRYDDAPFGLSIVVPAVAGPFDLGNVVVRSKIYVDKHDATLRVVSDPLPTILDGIPLDVRDVRVAIDKSDFIVNPTSCAQKTVSGTIASIGRATAAVSSRFQVGDCASLGFKPRMVLTVGGRGHTARNRSTPFTTTLTMPPTGQANLRFVRVTLPTTINARLTVINDACTRAEFEADLAKCAHAQAGTATAVTPLLRDPLKGNVYFVKNGHPLPDLFVALRGQVAFDLIGRITIPGSKHLATTFETAPDVPIRSFTLKLFGDAQNGSVGAATNLCSAKGRSANALLDYIGQSGKVLQVAQPLKIQGCAKHKAKAHKPKRGKGAASHRGR